MPGARTTTALAWTVSTLSVLGVVFSVGFLMNGGANDGFEQYPTVTRLHVIPGLVYLALAPFQFSATVRNNHPAYHRWTGRLLATLGLSAGATALFIGIVIPFSGLPEQIVVGGFGIFFLVSIGKGFFCARARRFAEHREWMMRAFSIGLSIVTMRLIFIPILIAIGNPTAEQAAFYSIISFTLAFFSHWLAAEWWIRRTRHPATRVSPAPVTAG